MRKIFLIFVLGLLGAIYAQDNNDLYVINTVKGDIIIELFKENAPRAVKAFKHLADKNFYDNCYVHRVIPNFMIQMGDPNTIMDTLRANDGLGKPNFNFDNEINPFTLGLDTLLIKNSEHSKRFSQEHPLQNITVLTYLKKQGYRFTSDVVSLPHSYGAVSFANSGPNSNGSQFFIVTRKDGCDWLDGKHTVFGKVISGMDVVEIIQNVPVDENDNPLKEEQVTILSIHKKDDD